MSLRSLFFVLAFGSFFTLAQDQPNDSNGETVYISDDLIAYIHAGPGRNYRILGSVTAGTPVSLIQSSDDGEFIEIIDDKQRTGWVEAQNIMSDPSFRARLPQLQQDLEQQQQQNIADRQMIDQLQQRLADLESQRTQQLREYEQLSERYAAAASRLEQKDESEQREWFMLGGAIALAGIFIGIIITYLPKKKGRRDTWMN